jgi:transmembrane sensor
VGELRSIGLSDGSIVTLNTQSEIAIRYSKLVRSVELVRGEALFQVAKNAKRPFRVGIGQSVVQAVGTAFNIYRRPEGSIVTVIEGRVAILGHNQLVRGSQSSAGTSLQRTAGDIELSAGEQLTLAPRERVRRLAPSDIQQVTTWAQRRLVFKETTVKDVVAEFNRYNRTQIVIDDQALSRRIVTGTFESGDPESFVEFLVQQSNAMVRERSEGTWYLSIAQR